VNVLIAVLAGFAVTQVSVLCTTIYLHRGLAHRALTLREPAVFVCRFLLWITTGMRPREWVAVHRRHHASTDTAADPHSPRVLGFWRVQFGNAALYRKAARDELTVRRYARDVPADRLDRWFFNHSFVGLGVGIAILCVTLGWQTGLLAAAVHAVTYLVLGGAINAVGHQYGKRPHDNTATNVQALALATGGEGLHNNHHAAPTSANFALTARELDPGWWLVRLLVRARLATLRHEEIKLKQVA
jgi:stearoyl-CoA desaturase (delta-9 desaturase)